MDPDLATADPDAPESATGVTLDLAGLRAAANQVEAASTEVARADLPGIDPLALAGSVVDVIAGPALVTSRRARLVTKLATWVSSARTAADQFHQVEERNADRLHQS